jgi:hypothetical protein
MLTSLLNVLILKDIIGLLLMMEFQRGFSACFFASGGNKAVCGKATIATTHTAISIKRRNAS